MDDVEHILERLQNLEQAINILKKELEELKNNNEDLNSELRKDSIKNAFKVFNDVYGIAHDLKRQMKRTFRPTYQRNYYYDRDDYSDWDLGFDFSNLGNFISETVHNALSGIENIAESFDFEFNPRIAKIKVQPGSNIKFEKQSESHEYLPIVSDILHAKDILNVLENKILSVDGIKTATALSEDINHELDMLKEKRLIIQEKQGQQRYLITKLGKKVLHEMQNKKNEEDSNN